MLWSYKLLDYSVMLSNFFFFNFYVIINFDPLNINIWSKSRVNNVLLSIKRQSTKVQLYCLKHISGEQNLKKSFVNVHEIIKMKDKDVTNQMYLTLHFEQKWFLVTEKNCFRNLSITERKQKIILLLSFLSVWISQCRLLSTCANILASVDSSMKK